jgi:hypothetical protein
MMSNTEKVYVGSRILTDPATGGHERRVDVFVLDAETKKTLTKYKLGWHLNVRGHSETGFEWGYGGSGPAQVALAILCDHFGEETLARRHYMAFKWEVVAQLPRRGTESVFGHNWTITQDQIVEALKDKSIAI